MSTAPSPPPPAAPPAGGGGALPLQIGKAFIKQYYKTLVNTPAQLNRFYQPDSTVSRGMEPSAPTEPSCVAEVLSAPATNGEETSQGERVRKTFFDWAGKGIDEGGEDADDILRIELQGGAIDAQESVGGGILLVVTGHMYLPGKSSEKAYSFVHTFFLNNGAPPGRKKQFYVKNDILRFLEPAVAEEEEVVEEVVEEAVEEPEVAEVAEAPETQAEEPAPEVEDVPVEVTETAAVIEPIEYEPAADEEKVEVVEDEVQEPMAELSIEEEPAAEEEKIDVSTSSEESPPSSPSSAEGKKKRRRRRGGKSRSRSNSPDVEEEKGEEQPKAPSSWANLVASGASKKSETASDNKKGSKSKGSSKPDEKSSAKAAPAKAPPQSQPPTKESATQPQATQNKRTPEATLFIRNIPDPTKEEEIRALFEPHGNATGNKILGITLNTNRGFCFVDFDGQAAVDAIVDEAKSSLVKDPRTGRKDKSSFMAHGRVLDVERKVPGDRKSSGGNAGGGGNSGKFNRSSSPKDSGRRYGNRGSRGGGGGGGGGGGSRRSPSRGGNR